MHGVQHDSCPTVPSASCFIHLYCGAAVPRSRKSMRELVHCMGEATADAWGWNAKERGAWERVGGKDSYMKSLTVLPKIKFCCLGNKEIKQCFCIGPHHVYIPLSVVSFVLEIKSYFLEWALARPGQKMDRVSPPETADFQHCAQDSFFWLLQWKSMHYTQTYLVTFTVVRSSSRRVIASKIWRWDSDLSLLDPQTSSIP